MKLTRVAVIGCGHWGPHHVRTFNTLPGSKVVAVVDSDPKALARLKSLYPDIQYSADYRKVLANPKVDAVVVVTPTTTHYGIVRDALLKRKHVLCEKPLCQTSSQALELAQLAKKANRILMVGHVFLFNAGVIKLKEMLDAGEIGKLLYISSARTNLGPIRSDVNVAYDLAAHDISVFNWLLGSSPEWLSAVGGAYLQPKIEDVLFTSLHYSDNRIANIQTSWLNPKKVRQVTMVGSKKMVTWDDLELNTPIAIYDRGANATPQTGEYGEFLRISMWDADVRLPKIKTAEPLKAQDSHFLEAIARGKLNRSDGVFAAEVVKTLEAVNASIKLNGHPITVSS